VIVGSGWGIGASPRTATREVNSSLGEQKKVSQKKVSDKKISTKGSTKAKFHRGPIFHKMNNFFFIRRERRPSLSNGRSIDNRNISAIE
jgi:hypothetical protein